MRTVQEWKEELKNVKDVSKEAIEYNQVLDKELENLSEELQAIAKYVIKDMVEDYHNKEICKWDNFDYAGAITQCHRILNTFVFNPVFNGRISSNAELIHEARCKVCDPESQREWIKFNISVETEMNPSS